MRKSSLQEKVEKTVQRYNLIKNGDAIIVAVSGGPDSITLLHILYKMRKSFNLKLFVAHINHQIRKEANSDEEYVKIFCENKEIPFFSTRINIEEIAKKEKIGTELAGRKARYDFFEETLNKTNANKIAIAHNANDNAETVFMNLLRGSSRLRGIKPQRENKYIRPLIECTRKEIEDYCEKEKLEPRIDITNMENIYTRNKIRNLLIPYIQKEFNPNIIETINRASLISEEQEKYIQNQVYNAYNEILIHKKDNEIMLDLKKFNKKEKVIKSEIIRYTIKELCGNVQEIGKIHIEDILKLCNNNIGNKRLSPKKGLQIEVGKRQFKSKSFVKSIAKNKTICYIFYIIRKVMLFKTLLLNKSKRMEEINIEKE